MSNNLADLTGVTSTHRSTTEFIEAIKSASVGQIVVNDYNKVVMEVNGEKTQYPDMFPNESAYIKTLNRLISLCFDSDGILVEKFPGPFLELSFDSKKTDVIGSLHIAMPSVTHGTYALTIRKQPKTVISLTDLEYKKVISPEAKFFLEAAMQGRSNILVSGGGGAGKTTLLRALSAFVDGDERIAVVEEIAEIRLEDRHPDTVSLLTKKVLGEDGFPIKALTLDDLVRETLRMRVARVWVGETRGAEAYALIKAMNSGHDGSCTTIHGDSPKDSVRQVITYIAEAGISESLAASQACAAIDLIVQAKKLPGGKYRVTEISEFQKLEVNDAPILKTIYEYSDRHDTLSKVGNISEQLQRKWESWGVSLPDSVFY